MLVFALFNQKFVPVLFTQLSRLEIIDFHEKKLQMQLCLK